MSDVTIRPPEERHVDLSQLRQLRRIRWSVRGVLVLGVAASVTANVLHALPHPIAQTIAAWPPLALLLTVELISRVPVHRRSLAAVRLASTAAIAGIAAWVSYWHMAGVAARYGETDAAPYLLPLSVDGLVVVASVSLVELAGRIRTAESSPSPVPSPVPAVPVPVPASAVPVPVPVGTVPDPAPVPVPDPVPSPDAGTAAVPAQVSGQYGGDDEVVRAELLAQARAADDAHLAEHRRPISRDKLRKQLGINNAVAGDLLRQVKQDRPVPVPGPVPVPVQANGRVPVLSSSDREA